MSESPTEEGAAAMSADASALADRLIRPLANRYLLVLTAIAALIVLDQAVIQPQLMRLNFYAPVINVAGRQRMLSQKLCKEALAIELEQQPDARRKLCSELLGTLRRWSTAHQALEQGSRELNLQPIRSPRILESLHNLEPHFRAMRQAAEELAADQGQPGAGGEQSGTEQRVRVMLKHEPDYLSGMERAVGLLEAASQEQVAWLRGGALVAMMLALLLLGGVYFAVLRPATRLIRQQLEQLAASDRCHRALAGLLRDARDQLELRVAQRTAELRDANAALQREMRERERAEQRMQRLSGELAHASRVTALGQLATGLAHEINQPLATIVNYAGTCELLFEQELPGNAKSRQAVMEMKQAASRAGAIVRRMRNFVRPGPGQSAVEELNDLTREVLELCLPELRRADVELLLELSAAPTPVLVDSLQVQQVLVNLIQNAIQAMRNGAIEQRRLRLRTSLEGDEVQLDVADTGPGFGCEAEQDPFAPFFTTRPEGLGMGLAISRAIIEQHQGRIWAERHAARGATVCFRLPLCHTAKRSHESPADCVCR